MTSTQKIVQKILENEFDLQKTLQEFHDKELVNIVYNYLIKQNAAILGQLQMEVRQSCQRK